MIEFVKGPLVEKTPTYVVIEAGGIGYFINISLHTYSQLPPEGSCRIFTHLSIKEDAHTLYGFAEEAERRLFRLLISVNGIGAGTARMLLSSLSPSETESAIINGQAGVLQAVKGIGTKTAQRIVIELKDKLVKGTPDSHPIFAVQNNTTKDEALSALVTLGFAKNTAEKALDQVIKRGGNGLTVESLIKAALQSM
jgi:holliday junction DNA helicase RuvA